MKFGGLIELVYGTISVMKSKLLIAPTDNEYNDALEASLEAAGYYIEEGLRPYISSESVDESTFPVYRFNTIPLSYVPSALQNIIYDLACGEFKRKYMPKDYDQGFYENGIKELKFFIECNFKQGIIKFVGAEE